MKNLNFTTVKPYEKPIVCISSFELESSCLSASYGAPGAAGGYDAANDHNYIDEF